MFGDVAIALMPVCQVVEFAVVCEKNTPTVPFWRRTGSAITSKGSRLRKAANNITKAALLDLEIFKTLLPSFCRTANSISSRYVYRFYLGHDNDDPLFYSRRGIAAFQRTFISQAARFCEPRSVDVSLRLVPCRHAGRPAWAQNDAMLDAYLDGVDYFYRVNDDTRMVTVGWTGQFVRTLEKYDCTFLFTGLSARRMNPEFS
jgi:hypothetical protein